MCGGACADGRPGRRGGALERRSPCKERERGSDGSSACAYSMQRLAFGVRVRDDPTHPSLSPGTSSRSAAVQRLTPRRARRWHSILFTLVYILQGTLYIVPRDPYVTYVSLSVVSAIP